MQLSPSQRLSYHTAAVAQRTEAFNPLQSGHQPSEGVVPEPCVEEGHAAFHFARLGAL